MSLELAKGNDARAKELVAEAMAVRDRILGDLAKRRRVAQARTRTLIRAAWERR